tara:strand:+ start:136 stop:738 length:603 start_codon:yes stop_codon:yes gene_type:complete
MRIILIFLIAIFSFQSWTKADDIRDFEIEGVSIGDSLLNFISEDEIQQKLKITKNHYNYLKDPLKFREVYFIPKKNTSNTYQSISAMFKKNDTNYEISLIRGMIDYVEDFSGCISKRDEIARDIESVIPKYTKDQREGSSSLDKSGKSITNNVYYIFNSGDVVILVCNDWEEKFRKKNNWTEGLSVVIRTNEVGIWLQGG